MVLRKLNIADTIISIESKYPILNYTPDQKSDQTRYRFSNFIYKGKRKPHININVKVVRNFPKINNSKQLFITYHNEGHAENWRLLKNGKKYIYSCPLEDRKQLAFISDKFDKVQVYILAKEEYFFLEKEEREFLKKNNGFIWCIEDVVYDLLQVLMINYFALRNQGVFLHSIGVNDRGGKGIVFAGKSGAGKTTLAKFWMGKKDAIILNDDRTIVRKRKGKFVLYGSPWHGDLKDYLASRMKSAPLEKLFFIHHSAQNKAKRINVKQAFSLLYPCLFPTFWDKRCLENIVSYCEDIANSVSCYSLGFKKDRKVIDFVRAL